MDEEYRGVVSKIISIIPKIYLTRNKYPFSLHKKMVYFLACLKLFELLCVLYLDLKNVVTKGFHVAFTHIFLWSAGK